MHLNQIQKRFCDENADPFIRCLSQKLKEKGKIRKKIAET